MSEVQNKVTILKFVLFSFQKCGSRHELVKLTKSSFCATFSGFAPLCAAPADAAAAPAAPAAGAAGPAAAVATVVEAARALAAAAEALPASERQKVGSRMY